MPGMNNGLDPGDPSVIAAFRAAVLHQGIIAMLIFAVLSVAWVSVRAQPDGSRTGSAGSTRHPLAWVRAGLWAYGEPAGRQVLRIGFGLLWLADAALLTRPGMAAGLPSQVIGPAAVTSPAWVQHVAGWAGDTWSSQPVEVTSAGLWIEAGIGLWLLAAPRGTWSRLAGLASLAWGLVVWVFGESFGQIFAPGLSWLSGAPGAGLLYAVAGALLVLPPRFWRSPRLGQVLLGGLGVCLIGMAVLQAWPARGFWQGSTNGQPGTLADRVQTLAGAPQPHALSSLLSGFASLARAHGFAVNLVVVIALAATGLAFLTARRRVTGPALAAFGVLCLLAWVLTEDLGFLGNLGADPGSMIPMALLAVGGYLALTRVPAEQVQAEQVQAEDVPASPAPAPAQTRWPNGWRTRLGPAAVRRSLTAATFGTMASLGAVGVVLLGAVPMAAAQVTPAASVILAQSMDGAPNTMDAPAPGFTLTDQHGRQLSLAGLRGKVVLLTFLDPVCVTDCPLIAQEFRAAGQLLGASSRQVELVSVNLNPTYTQLAYVRAFDHAEGLDTVPNWHFVTSDPATLRQVWHAYGVASQNLPAGAMLGHSDIAFVVDRRGHLVQELNMDPGPGTAITKSSFAAELADAARQTLKSA
jgi:cytochrome oxidase Cu insertion factor (SCO1/SenC/PrrC family)